MSATLVGPNDLTTEEKLVKNPCEILGGFCGWSEERRTVVEAGFDFFLAGEGLQLLFGLWLDKIAGLDDAASSLQGVVDQLLMSSDVEHVRKWCRGNIFFPRI